MFIIEVVLLALVTRLVEAGPGGRESYLQEPAWLSPSSCSWSLAIASLQSIAIVIVTSCRLQTTTGTTWWLLLSAVRLWDCLAKCCHDFEPPVSSLPCASDCLEITCNVWSSGS